MLNKLIAVAAGLVVTFGLLFLMQGLIATGQSAMTEAVTTHVVDFVRVQRAETLERRESKPERPSNPEAPPPDAPQPSLNQNVDNPGQAVGGLEIAPVSAGQIDFDIGTGFGVVAGSADGDYLPLVRVAPMYPRRAEQQNIEGWVILELTVTETGSVKDVRVISCHPSDIFNRAAVNAALRFKYKPRVVNGKPIEVRGVRYKMTFQLVD
jgi:protein TonB